MFRIDNEPTISSANKTITVEYNIDIDENIDILENGIITFDKDSILNINDNIITLKEDTEINYLSSISVFYDSIS